jgi:hypothetical protein
MTRETVRSAMGRIKAVFLGLGLVLGLVPESSAAMPKPASGAGSDVDVPRVGATVWARPRLPCRRPGTTVASMFVMNDDDSCDDDCD